MANDGPIGRANIELGVDASKLDAGLSAAKSKVEESVKAAEQAPAAAADDSEAYQARLRAMHEESIVEAELVKRAQARAAAEAQVGQHVRKQTEEKKAQAKDATQEDHAASGLTGGMSVAAYSTAIGLLATAFERLFNGMTKVTEAGRHFAEGMRDIETTFRGDALNGMDAFTQKMEALRAKQEQTYRQILESQTLLDAITNVLYGKENSEAQAKLNKLAEESANAAREILKQTLVDGKRQIAELNQEVRKFREELNKTGRFPSVAFDISKIAEFAAVLAKNVEASR